MKTLVVSIAALALVAGSVNTVSAATKDVAGVVKASASSCATSAKPVKVAKGARVVHRCQTDDGHHIGVVPLVFGGAIVAGVVAIAVTNSGNDNATSP
jgi:hypothetical protein